METVRPSKLLRAIDSPDTWLLHRTKPEVWSSGRVPAYCLHDLRDKNSSPSVFSVESAEDLDDAAAALAYTRLNSNQVPTFYGLVFDYEAVAPCADWTATDGETEFAGVNSRHWQAQNATALQLAEVGVAIHANAAVSAGAGTAARPGLVVRSPLEVAMTWRSLIERGEVERGSTRRRLETLIRSAFGL